MPSLYAQYLKERMNDNIIENHEGFVTYRYLNKTQVYIVDIFILPEHRKQGAATALAGQVCAQAKFDGYKEVVGTVNPTAKNATDSLKVLLAYGMHLVSCETNMIILKKDL